MIAAVAAVNPHTLVVLITGNPVSMPWIDHVAGVMEAWYPGIGGGQAIANLLFGSVVPSAKLAVTFARSEVDLPHERIFGAFGSAAKARASTHWVADEEKRQTLSPTTMKGCASGYKWFDSEANSRCSPSATDSRIRSSSTGVCRWTGDAGRDIYR